MPARRSSSVRLLLTILGGAAVGGGVVLACTGEGPVLTNADPKPDDDASTSGGDAAPPGDDADGSDGAIAEADAGGMSLCDGRAVDLAGDPDNCGVCKKSCGGGRCSAGVCQPFTIAKGLDHPYGVAVSGSGVIWVRAGSTGGAVETCPSSGCPAAGPRVVSKGVVAPVSTTLPLRGATIASDGVVAQWIARQKSSSGVVYNRLFTCNITVCTEGYEASTWHVGSVVDLQRDGANLFYRLEGGHIYATSFGTNSGSDNPNIAGSSPGSPGFATTSGKLYYGSPFGENNNVVFACSRNGLDACSNHNPAFNVGPAAVSFVGVSGGDVYAVSRARFLRCAGGACSSTPQELTDALPDVAAFAIDDERAYFADKGDTKQGNGRILTCELPACAGGPRAIAVDQASPVSLAVDQGVLYWANAGADDAADGAIQKLHL